ncbi:glycerophosphodiester phosphodiesterase family protein, partial [Pirellulales bacterium]|nr:glycerophosphodiester phosphodiesterase family protein [Pirellulales bacterium]
MSKTTSAALHRAIEVGATAVEVDVRTSRDGRLFLLHDTTLDRATNGKGPASALALAQLQRLDAGSHFDPKYRGEQIPSLIGFEKGIRKRGQDSFFASGLLQPGVLSSIIVFS